MIHTIDNERCIACKVCQEVCMKDVIRWSEEIDRPLIRYLEDCQTCYDCEISCPSGAIWVHPMHKEKVMAW
jgi:NAD-dependent dihydropyrimidine dehydrogenase PreA subunit